MDQSKFELWVKRILETEEEEISCSECFDLVSHYVDKELAGASADPVLRRVRQHLQQCRACREEYEILRELAQLEASGGEDLLKSS